MGESTSWYPSLSVDTAGRGIVSQAGSITLVRTAQQVGLIDALSAGLRPWRKPLASHNPGKILTDLAIAVAIGGDCLADLAVLRGQSGVFGLVASDPTVSRLIATLAADADAALAAINTARATARAAAWSAAAPRPKNANPNPLRPPHHHREISRLMAVGIRIRKRTPLVPVLLRFAYWPADVSRPPRGPMPPGRTPPSRPLHLRFEYR